MSAMKKNFLINICLLFLSSLGSIAVSYSVYSYMAKNSQQSFQLSEGSPWDYSFFNQKGRKISDLTGMLKFVTDPFTIYKNYPNQKSPNYSIDKYGFREGYRSNKPYTAMVIGGSAAFGYALDDDSKTFSSIISFSNDKYNTINSSVIGFMSGQELSQMIHYLDDFNPNLYIVFDGWNDVAIPYDVTKIWPVMNPLIGYNPAFMMIEGRLADYFQMTRKDKNAPEVRETPIGELFDERQFSDEIVKVYTANIRKMYDFAYSRGAEFVVVFQPELGNKKLLSENEKEILASWGSRFGYLDRKIPSRYKLLITRAKMIFQERKIPFIDINGEPEFSENPETLFFDVVHPNEIGHKIIANIINHKLSSAIQK
jgi:GDSL-like Lipase/Acylhydrolase